MSFFSCSKNARCSCMFYFYSSTKHVKTQTGRQRSDIFDSGLCKLCLVLREAFRKIFKALMLQTHIQYVGAPLGSLAHITQCTAKLAFIRLI